MPAGGAYGCRPWGNVLHLTKRRRALLASPREEADDLWKKCCAGKRWFSARCLAKFTVACVRQKGGLCATVAAILAQLVKTRIHASRKGVQLFTAHTHNNKIKIKHQRLFRDKEGAAYAAPVFHHQAAMR